MGMKLSAIIIGLGNQSLTEHIPALLRRNDIRIVGACDVSADARENFKKQFPAIGYGTLVTNNLDELIEKTRPNIAIVAVPHDSYFDIVKKLCQNNIYFLKEKPFARNLLEAESFMKIPNFGKLGFIAAQRRYNPLYQEAKVKLADIGRPYLFSATYKLNIDSPHSGWRGSKNSAGGGCIIDMGYHIVDQLLWWFGAPKKLHAQTSSLAVAHENYDAEDTATVSFGYENGMHGNLLISRAAGEKTEEYAVYGSNGSIVGSKKQMTVFDRQGHILKQVDLSSPTAMIDAQLDFFISRVNAFSGFGDVQKQHINNMTFIERCYEDAKTIN